jgi:dolichol kinase
VSDGSTPQGPPAGDAVAQDGPGPRAVSGFPLRAELGRKATHLALAALPVAWARGVLDDDVMRALLLGGLGVALLVEALRRWAPPVRRLFLALTGPLLRPHEHAGLTGATWLALALALLVLTHPPAATQVALWAVAVGDGLAAVVGRLTGGAHGTKSIAGSATCLLATALGAWWLGGAGPAPAVAIGAVAAIAERPRVALDDNFRVALATGLAAWGLLPA